MYRIVGVTATQSIEELAPYKATAHACTIGMSMDSDIKMRSRRWWKKGHVYIPCIDRFVRRMVARARPIKQLRSLAVRRSAMHPKVRIKLQIYMDIIYPQSIWRDSLGYSVGGTKSSSLVARFLTILVVYLVDKAI